MEDSAIQVRAATRRFGNLAAVDALSFAVEHGEIFGLLGPNGAGKTTAINLLTGLLRRDGGEVRVLGYDPQRQAREVRQRIGYVPQETNIYLDLSAVDNLWHHAALYCRELRDLILFHAWPADWAAMTLKLVGFAAFSLAAGWGLAGRRIRRAG